MAAWGQADDSRGSDSGGQGEKGQAWGVFCAVLLRAVQESSSLHLSPPQGFWIKKSTLKYSKFTWTSATTSCSSASAKDLMSLLLITLLKSEREQQHEPGRAPPAARSAGTQPDLISHRSGLPQSSFDFTPAIITQRFQAGRELTQKGAHALSSTPAFCHWCQHPVCDCCTESR